MNKYVTPKIEKEELETSDVILASKFQIAELEGVDSNGSKTAIFDVSTWF